MKLPEQIVEFENMKASGPGGQNVNKRATAVRLRVQIDDLPLEEEEKEFVRQHMPPRFKTKDDELLFENAESRSQKRNREQARDIAREEIENAIEAGRRKQVDAERKKRIQRSSSGSSDSEDRAEKQKRRRRSESTEDFIEQAMEQDPDLMKNVLENRPNTPTDSDEPDDNDSSPEESDTDEDDHSDESDTPSSQSH